MSQDKKNIKSGPKAPAEEESKKEVKKTDSDGKDLKDAVDNLIDEIDEALEDNAEEFVNNYVQKGGE